MNPKMEDAGKRTPVGPKGENGVVASGRGRPVRETGAVETGAWPLLLPLGLGLGAFPAGLLVLTALTILAGGTISWWQAPLAFLLSLATAWASALHLSPAGGRRLALSATVSTAALVLLAGLGSGMVYDMSWDGQSYQQDSVIQLAAGWNPIHSAGFPVATSHEMELTHWAKGMSYCEAAVYRATGRIETGKMFHWVLLAAAFCLSWQAFRSLMAGPPWLVTWLAGLAAGSPVSLGQVLTFYIDGALSSWLVILGACLCLYGKQERRWQLAGAAVSTMCLVTVKFTAVAYAALFLLPLVAVFLARRHFGAGARLAGVFFLAGLTGTAVLGWHPYVTNAVRFGHPFYPMAGPGSFYHSILLNDQLPRDFYGRNRLEKFGRSLFGPVDNVCGQTESRLKAPFSLTWPEVLQMREFHAVRLGGWGPWFGPAFVLSLLLLALLAGGRDPRAGPLALVAVPLLLPILLVSESWWARFYPQLALLPVLAAGAGWLSGRRGLKALSLAVLAVLTVNNLTGPGIGNLYLLKQSRSLDACLDRLAEGPQPVAVYFWWFGSTRLRLAEHGIRYREVSDVSLLPSPNPDRLPGTWVRYCVP